MKKVLFATTALVMTAGVAAAEVTLSGDGRMGLLYDGNDVNFTSRARVKFTLTGESDSGLSFGGSFRADQAGRDTCSLGDDDEDPSTPDVVTCTGAAGANNGGLGSVYISGSYGKLSFGDVDGAAEQAVGDLHGVGLTGLGDRNETTYIHGGASANDPVALYEYSAGALTAYASMMDQNDDESYAVGAKYAMGDYTFGLGYEDNGMDSHWVLGGEGAFGPMSVKAIYGKSSDLDFEQYGLSGVYDANALAVTAFWVRKDTAGVEMDSMGLGAAYDLGGGASLKGGIVDSDDEDDTIADFGVAFTF